MKVTSRPRPKQTFRTRRPRRPPGVRSRDRSRRAEQENHGNNANVPFVEMMPGERRDHRAGHLIHLTTAHFHLRFHSVGWADALESISPFERSVCTTHSFSGSSLCALAAWWQVGRAIQGNSLSFLYSIEWPLIGVLGIRRLVLAVEHREGLEHKERARREYEEKMRADALKRRATGRRPRGGRPLARRLQRSPGTAVPDAQETTLGSLVDGTFRRYRAMSYITGTNAASSSS